MLLTPRQLQMLCTLVVFFGNLFCSVYFVFFINITSKINLGTSTIYFVVEKLFYGIFVSDHIYVLFCERDYNEIANMCEL